MFPVKRVELMQGFPELVWRTTDLLARFQEAGTGMARIVTCILEMKTMWKPHKPCHMSHALGRATDFGQRLSYCHCSP